MRGRELGIGGHEPEIVGRELGIVGREPGSNNQKSTIRRARMKKGVAKSFAKSSIKHTSFDAEYFKEKMVREMRPEELPREKLVKYGADTLTDAELLAILLRTGSAKLNVLQTARALLDHFQGLKRLVREDWISVQQIPGIAKVKAITLEASFELARRIQMSQTGEKFLVRSPEDANSYLRPYLRDLTKEYFMVIFLDNAKHVLGHKIISRGGRNATVVEPSEVMRYAILNHSNSIILAHNHPSGIAVESHADRNITARIVEAGKMLGIEVDDHIIVAGDTYVSFRNKNLI